MTRYLKTALLAAAALLASCIHNDIPYPVVELRIASVEGQGFSVSENNVTSRTVTLSLDEATDIRNVRIDAVGYDAVIHSIQLDKEEVLQQIRSSRELTGTFDLRSPIYTTLSLYQDYEWTIRATQTIERRFSVTGQIGATEIEEKNRIARVLVPRLKCSVSEGRLKYPENRIIVRKARQMFVHKLAGMGRTQLLPFLVYAFTSLKLVAYYGNYMLLLTKLNQFVDNFLGSTGAGVGSLIAEGDMKRIQQVFWELSSLRFLIASFLTFALYHLMDPFITVWLGEEYILPRSVLIVILTNFFISQFRGTNDQFIFGYGLFHDTWAPVATLAITVAVALAGGYLWGLPGVLLGDIASSITVISIWKPYFLYKEGFKMSVKSYWKNIFRYLLLAVLSWGLTDAVLCFLPLAEPSRGYGMWIVYALVSSLIFLLILCSSFYCCSAGIRSLVKRLRRK